ncbi:YiiX/YebB-like N1pC/P60 family cysteine hydrolase [Nitratireductor sp. GISD-1A_MAKvit]|uniref:YiiX/YebB-like N1pC/P60 family cysteine hydrolase n=1 Tax=Nitratireductor sp. GISD-1A_MAKvit TaxID=3234198 RepID=UPI00346536B9
MSSVVPVVARPIAKLAGNLRLRNGHLAGRDDIRAVLQRELRPFDVVLLSAPYKGTSLFIPGHFSHAGIWFGDMDDWRGVEIAPRLRSALVDRKGFFHADRDGVRFSDIDEILDADHVTVVRLSTNVRLVDVADKINAMSVRSYDFNFDGTDNSELLCTELVLEFLGMDPVATTGILGRSFVTPDQLFQTLLMNGAYRITIADDIQSRPSARIPKNQRQLDIRTARNS